MEVEIEFVKFSTFDDFNLIAKILTDDLNYRLLEKVDGPDAKALKFSNKDFQLWLVYDDMAGNFLKTENLENLENLKEIHKKVKTFMKSA